MSTPSDEADLNQGLAGALQGNSRSAPYPGLAQALLGGSPGLLQDPGSVGSLAQGLTFGLPAIPARYTPVGGFRTDPYGTAFPTIPVGQSLSTAAPPESADQAPIATNGVATNTGDNPGDSDGDEGGETPGAAVAAASPAQQLTPAFDVDKAIGYLDRNATPSYSRLKNGHCGRAVRKAIEAGGLKIGHAESAKDYGPNLVAAGFKKLDVQGFENYNPQKGDVIIYPAILGATQNHKNGHIQMFDGAQWVSDFKQHGQYLGGEPGNDFHSKPFTVYRP
ncbi:MAG TPA: hypothetical protein VGT99_13840 [Gammaproteobacteria bacterium]|nr:hypothetical protein [Gammaproteobacteria bacterium]